MSWVTISEIEAVTKAVLVKCGVPGEDAAIVSDSIVYAHRRGKGTHGIMRLPIYVRKIRQGLMDARTPLSVVREGPVISILDAAHGFGQVAGIRGMQRCMDTAQKMGIGVVGIRHSNNFGTAGFVAEAALNNGMIGVVLGNSAPAIAPWGGQRPLLGTNPLAIAFPGGKGHPPIVLDMATAAAARGKIRLAAKNGEKIPLGWALDAEGRPTDDPKAALKGSMVPMGGHKGYGLSLVIDMLAGLLTGAAFAGGVKPLNAPVGHSNYGHLLLALSVDSFMPMGDYIERVDELVRNVKSCGVAGAIHLPGEQSIQKQDMNALAVELSPVVRDEINALAQTMDVPCALQ